MHARKLPAIALVALLGLGLSACTAAPTGTGSVQKGDSTAQVDLTGEWEQSNSGGTGAAHVATFVGDTMSIYWKNDDGTKMLYWAGSVEVPQGTASSFSWESINDKSKTSTALLASPADSKTFEYSNGVVSYEASALGQTWTVELRQTSTTPAAGPTNEAEADSEYEVKITGASFSTNYNDEPVIVVSYDFTNNSAEAQSFMFAVQAQAFQGGVELDGLAIGVDEVDTSLLMADIKPGTTVTIKDAYVLRDSSTVSVEVREFSFVSDALLASQDFTVSG